MPFLFIPHGCPAYLKYALLMGTGSIITAVPFRVTILGQDHLHSSLKKIKEKNFNAEPYRDELGSKLTIQTYILQFLNFQLANNFTTKTKLDFELCFSRQYRQKNLNKNNNNNNKGNRCGHFKYCGYF